MALEFAKANHQYETMATLLDVVPSAISIVVRFKRLSTFDSDETFQEVLIDKANIVGQDRLFVLFSAVDGKLYFYTEENNAGVISISSTTISWTAGQEYLIVCTWGAINGMQLFVNTIREANNAGATDLERNGVFSDFFFCSALAIEYYTDITVSDFRVYGKELSNAEIASIYYGQGNDNIVDDLLCRQLMNEKTDGQAAAGANVVIDISGNGHHGTPVNNPVYRAAPVKLIRSKIATGIGS